MSGIYVSAVFSEANLLPINDAGFIYDWTERLNSILNEEVDVNDFFLEFESHYRGRDAESSAMVLYIAGNNLKAIKEK